MNTIRCEVREACRHPGGGRTLFVLQPFDVREGLLGGGDQAGAALLHSPVVLVLLVEALVVRAVPASTGRQDPSGRLEQSAVTSGQGIREKYDNIMFRVHVRKDCPSFPGPLWLHSDTDG